MMRKINSCSIFIIFVAFFLALISFFILSQMNKLLLQRLGYGYGYQYQIKAKKYKKKHAFQERKLKNGDYYYSMTFRDHRGQEWTWRWRWKKHLVDQSINKYGIPDSMFERYNDTPEVRIKRAKIMKDGFFMKHGKILGPDFNAIVADQAAFTKPLYDLLVQSTPNSSPREKLSFIFKLVQDIPYGIPPDKVGDKNLSGYLTPVPTLHEMWGDCDSKSALLARKGGMQ